MQPGRFATVAERDGLVSLDEERDHRRFARKKLDPDTANVDGFDIHAGVFASAEDRHARERLFRYGARPAVSLSRMSRLPDGRIAYRLKHPGPYEHTHRVMTPVEFLARVAALTPPAEVPARSVSRCLRAELALAEGRRTAARPGATATCRLHDHDWRQSVLHCATVAVGNTGGGTGARAWAASGSTGPRC